MALIPRLQTIPPPVQLKALRLALLLVAIIGSFSANPLESVFAIAQLLILLKAYWRQNTPPVVLLLFLIPWLEINAGILESNLRMESLDNMLHGSGKTAYWMSSLGLVAVHAGFYPFYLNSWFGSLETLKQAASGLSLNRLIIAYYGVGPLTNFIAGFIGRGSSLYQFITYLNEISSVILIVICLRQAILNEANRTFVVFIIVTLFLSFYSFFSEWQIVLFALFIGYGLIHTLTPKIVIRIVFFGVFFGNVLFLWQAIKPIYRSYLTGQESFQGGLKTQAVTRSRADALAKFVELSQDFYQGNLRGVEVSESGANDLLYSTLRRVGYLEFMAMTINKVPSEVEHENGTLLRQNLSFALIPRILNPNKGKKDDGAKVEKYTGFMVSESASFSLGHYVEYFIDFGRAGMLLILILYGVIGGRIAQMIRSKAHGTNALFVLGILYVTLRQWGSFQNDAIWIYGLTFFGCICHLYLFRPIYSALIKFSGSQ